MEIVRIYWVEELESNREKEGKKDKPAINFINVIRMHFIVRIFFDKAKT